MENFCNCLDLCKCLGGCCKKFCGSPECEHEVYECICYALCDFCKKEKIEELAKLEIENENFTKKRSYNKDDDSDEYDADDDSDSEDNVKQPIKKMRFNIYNL